jgi:hypothetical protein
VLTITRRLVRLTFALPVILIAAAPTMAPAAASDPLPEIEVSGEIPTGWLSGGEYVIAATATSSTPLAGYGWSLGVPTTPVNCLPRVGTEACQNAVSSAYVIRPTQLLDGAYDLFFSVATQTLVPVGTGGVSTFQTVSRRFPLRIDHTAPVAPKGIAVIGGTGWRSANAFDVTWQGAPDAGSPIVGTEYRLCPAGQPNTSPACLIGRRDGDPGSLAGIGVPGTGVWRLQVALRDALGHIDLDSGAATELRLDADPPSLAFRPEDPHDPARVHLAVADEASGIGEVAIEARRQGENAWRTLELHSTADGVSAVLDDNELAAGDYELRGRAVDVVGNERTVARWRDGHKVVVQLPVRQTTVLEAGIRVHAKRRAVLEKRPLVRYGKASAISGRVTDAFGHHRAGVRVDVQERIAAPGAQWRSIATRTSDGDGTFTFRAPPGPARTIRFHHAGTPTSRPAAADVALRVRASTTLEPSRRRLINGDTVVLRGRLLGRPLPVSGKVVVVQAWTERGWRTFGNTRARAGDGRWTYRYRFTGTTMTSRYRFRAVVPVEDSYPYVTGSSRVAAVIVRGAHR